MMIRLPRVAEGAVFPCTRGVDMWLFRFQSALIASRSPPEWISDLKM